MNRTGDPLLCSWTTFQYAMKADGDVGLAVAFKLLYSIYYMTSRPMNINQPWKVPGKARSYLLSSLYTEKNCWQDMPQPISMTVWTTMWLADRE